MGLVLKDQCASNVEAKSVWRQTWDTTEQPTVVHTMTKLTPVNSKQLAAAEEPRGKNARTFSESTGN